MPLKPSYRGYVYMIGSRRFGWYKIGKANNPVLRLSTLGILLPFKVELIYLWGTARPLALESHLHERFSEHRINGEWFAFVLADLPAIGQLDLPHFSELVPSAVVRFSTAETDVLDDSFEKLQRKQKGALHAKWFREYIRQNAIDMADKKQTKEAHRIVNEMLRGQDLTGDDIVFSAKSITLPGSG